MKKIKKAALLFIAMCAVFIVFCKTENAEASSIILDPGHDATHTGANANGIAEETVNLKIAQYCYDELQTYENVGLVYLTRNGAGCPYPGTTSTQCNKKRVEFAKSMGASIYVSIHNNSAKTSSANGASVYYPNGNYRSSIGTAGERLANIVQSHLIALGLANRGTLIRDSEDNTRYPDGSLADYYGVIKNSKLAGFTAIIIEHAFLTNSSDVANYLSTDAQLKLLGIADATAIAEYYGLSKKSVWDKNVSDSKVSAIFTSDYKKVTASITGLSNAPNVSLAVWSEKDGQDDLKWYSASKNSAGNWVYDIPVSDFNKSGYYNVHVYASDETTSVFACETTFYVGAPTASGINTNGTDTNLAKLCVNVTGVSAKSGIDYVKVAVWTKSDQSDLKWLDANEVSSGNYSVAVNFSDYDYAEGEYYIHAYAADKNGIFEFVNKTVYELVYPTAVVSASMDLNDTQFTINALALPFGNDVSYVRAAVWSKANGQDDLKWYTMQKNGTTYTCTEYFMSHLTDETVVAHIYAYMKNGKSIYSGNATFEASQTHVAGSYDGKLNENMTVSWSGNRTNIIAENGQIQINPAEAAASGESVAVSGESATVSGESTAVSQDGAAVSGESVAVSGESIVVSQDGAAVSGESVAVSGESIVVSQDGAAASGESVTSGNSQLISENLYMKEEIYSIKDDFVYYNDVKSLMSSKLNDLYKTFVIRGVDMGSKSDKYIYSLNGKVCLQFKLPDKFIGKEIVIYDIRKENDGISLGNSYDVSVTDDGYAQIYTDVFGDFVIAADKAVQIAGDLDYDGEVTLPDVVLLLKAALGITNLTDEQLKIADINSDGSVNLADAQLSLKIALGIL